MNAGYRPAVPRKWLLGPLIAFAMVVAILALLAFVVPDALNIHGGWGAQFLLVFLLTFIIAGVVELFAIAISITALFHSPALRTPANFVALAVGAGPFVALASWLIYRM